MEVPAIIKRDVQPLQTAERMLAFCKLMKTNKRILLRRASSTVNDPVVVHQLVELTFVKYWSLFATRHDQKVIKKELLEILSDLMPEPSANRAVNRRNN